MQAEIPSTPADSSVFLELLDPMRGHAIQSWQFSKQSLIRIGRSNDNDITLGDPQVSRLHVELHLRAKGWELVSNGRHGTLVADELVEQWPLQDGTILQLGPSGPKLRFRQSRLAGQDESTITMMRPGLAIREILQLDEQRTDEQVREIVETPSFRRVRELARKLRKDDSTSEEPTKEF